MFKVSFNRVFANEGSFQDDYKDRGNWSSGKVRVGELRGTKFGISAAAYPKLDIKNLTKLRAERIYRRDWWDALNMDSFKPALQYQMFDAAVNHGMHNATRIFQHAVGVKADGVIGPITKSKAAEIDVNDLLLHFLAERLVFITHIKTWSVFGKGWSRRIAHNLKYAARDN